MGIRLCSFLWSILAFVSPAYAGETVDPYLKEILRLLSSGIKVQSSLEPSCSLPGADAQLATPKTCSDLARQYEKEDAIREAFFSAKDKAIKNDLRKKLFAEEKVTEKFARACVEQRFEQCYAKLKPAITQSDLESLFREYYQDPKLRYGSGQGACGYRAAALAYRLAEAGYAAKTIRIEGSPTLIAMDRNRKGQLTGGYEDYHGYHAVTQIMVESAGRRVPYILDLQYMTRPLPRDEYFICTTGQVCGIAENSDLPSYLNCTFRVLPQNAPTDTLNAYAILHTKSRDIACGWEKDQLKEDLAEIFSQELPVPGELRSLNQESDPASDLKNLQVTEDSYRMLIRRAYKNYEAELVQNLEESRHQAALLRESLARMPTNETKEQLMKQEAIQVQIGKDLRNLPNKIREVSENLQRLRP